MCGWGSDGNWVRLLHHGNRITSFGSASTERIFSLFLNQLRSPEGIVLVVVDGANVAEIEWYIFLIGLGADEDHRLVECVSKTEFVQHVRIAARKLCQQDAGRGDALPISDQ